MLAGYTPGVADPERDLIAAMRRLKTREAAFHAATAERDQLIRAALDARVPHARIIAITELSPSRIDQIRRGERV